VVVGMRRRPALLLALAGALGYGWWHAGQPQPQLQPQPQPQLQPQLRPVGRGPGGFAEPQSSGVATTMDRSELLQGELLREGAHLASPRGLFFLRMEGGVAMARRGSPASPGQPLWDSAAHTSQPARRSPHALALQADGALVVISDDRAAAPILVWSSGVDAGTSKSAGGQGGTHYALRLEDGGDDASSSGGYETSWAASVYDVPDQLHGALHSVPGRLVQRLFAVSPDSQLAAENPPKRPAPHRLVLHKHSGGRTGDDDGPGRVCFRLGSKSAECVLQCGAAEGCSSALRNLWDAQALCSLRSNCSGVARLRGQPRPGGTAALVSHGHPLYDFRLCKANGGVSRSTAHVDEPSTTWMKSPCDADPDSETAALLQQLHLVMTVKTSGQVHSTRVQ
jgi:hypothetical protein